jgi:hypothetical protein
MGSEFRRLRAYELAISLARDINAAVSGWENFKRWHPADQRRVPYFARGSLSETEHWIAVAKDRGLLKDDADERIPELARTLNGLIRKREPG